MEPLGFQDRRPTRSRGTRDPVLSRTGSRPAFWPRVVGIDDFERWIKTRCDVKGCWNTAVTTCIECDARLCREHICYDDTLPYCRRCLYWDDETVELIEVGEW